MCSTASSTQMDRCLPHSVTAWVLCICAGLYAGAGANGQTGDEKQVQESRQITIALQGAVSGDGHDFRLFRSGAGFGVSPRRLAEFAERYPNADANGDGRVGNAERQAYLTARALSAPQAVLSQFPHADRNQDGALDTLEAARLVSNPFAYLPANIAVAHPGESMGAMALRITTGDEDSTFETTQEITISAEDGERGEHMVVVVNGVELFNGPPPARWVQDNIETEIEPETVAQLQEQIRLGRNAEFLQGHPEADADESGVLSDEERQVFEEALTARMLERIEQMRESGEFDVHVGEDGVQVLRAERVAVAEDGVRVVERGDSPPEPKAGKEKLTDDKGVLTRAAELKLKGDEWYEYTVAFIKRYGLTELQKKRAFKELMYCYRLRDSFVKKLRNKDEAKRKARIEQRKQEIFEKQLKRRLDRIPTAKQRIAVKAKTPPKP